VSEFVTCAACGARMKADRQRCLRCDEPLAAVAGRPSPAPVRLSARQWTVALGGGALALAGVAALLWAGRPVLEEETAQAYTAPRARTSARTASARGASDDSDSRPMPVAVPPSAAFLDSSRGATAAFTTGDFAAARAKFEEALKHKPDDPSALNGLGQALIRTGDLRGALARFERAAELAPGEWEYRFNLGHALSRLSMWDRAITEYRQAATLFPGDYATQFNLAMSLHKKGDFAAAIPEFERAIELAPAEGSFHIALGNSFERVGKLAEARREFARYLEMEPSAPDAAAVKAHLDELDAALRAPGTGRASAESATGAASSAAAPEGAAQP
jgi:tetratricopeptide (TPR) repeat protein